MSNVESAEKKMVNLMYIHFSILHMFHYNLPIYHIAVLSDN